MVPLYNPFGPARQVNDVNVVITSIAKDEFGDDYFGVIIVLDRPDCIGGPNVVV